jgi:hypothetical protein
MAILKTTGTISKCNTKLKELNLLYEWKEWVGNVIKIFKPVTGIKCVYTKFKQRSKNVAKLHEIILCDLETVAYNKQAKFRHLVIPDLSLNYPNTLQTISCNKLLEGSYRYCNG